MESSTSPAASRYFNQPGLSDITLKFGHQQVYAHRYALCVNSEYFRKLLVGDFAEKERKEITLVDDDEDAMLAMLRHIYQLPYLPATEGETTALPHARVYVVAEKYGQVDLKAAVFERLFTGKTPWKAAWRSLTSDADDTLRVIFSQIPAEDNLLRPALAKFCAEKMGKWASDKEKLAFKRLLADTPDLAAEVLYNVAQSLNDTIKVFSCPFCQFQRIEFTRVDDFDHDLGLCEFPNCNKDITYALADRRNWATYQERSGLECDMPLTARYEADESD
nr:hypothetical protein B0A51_09911 [Rachicladosporium sp. CCFEE 5018]OQO22392.1 hypothetical protein B0A51_10855 [Rachicladosporium sp. CCFEE 5018]